MTRVERDPQPAQRFVRFSGRQRFRRSPEPRNARFRNWIRSEAQSESGARFAIGQNLRGIVLNLDQVLRETVRAIDVVYEMREFVVRNRVLIIFEYAPFGFAAEDAKIIGGRGEAGDD